MVSISETDAYRAHLVQLLSVAGDGVGEVDDVEDLGAAEAGDLHGTHAREVKGPPSERGQRSAHTTCGRIGMRAIARPERAFER